MTRSGKLLAIMVALRQTLRAVAATWLAIQVAWLAALVPRDCCAAHPPAEKSCHESPAATHCPMPAADGTPCPMHRSNAAEHEEHTPPPPADCRLRGVCDGPMSALLTLLSNHGTLPEAAPPVPRPDARLVETVVDVSPLARFETPDSPPPRA